MIRQVWHAHLVGRQGEIWVIQTDTEFLNYGNTSFRSPGPAGLRSGLLVYLHEVLLHNWTIVQPRTVQSSLCNRAAPAGGVKHMHAIDERPPPDRCRFSDMMTPK